MKTAFLSAFWLSFFLGIFILTNELLFNFWSMRNIEVEPYGLPVDSKTLEFASKDEDYVDSQQKALSKRVKRVWNEILRHFYVLAAGLLFLNLSFRNFVKTLVTNLVKTFPKYRDSVKTKEMITISFIITLFLASVFGGTLISDIENITIVGVILFYIFLFIFIIPILYFIENKLLKIYSRQLIIACYIAYFVKAISELVSVDDVNLESMMKVDIKTFSPEVQSYLKERGLEERVYAEKGEVEKSLNAALVGWGAFERIEIYGKYDELSGRELESILMHEIGHSQDHSLTKKILILFTIKLIEMCVMLKLYMVVSEKFSDELISRNGAFFALLFIYLLFINRWLFIFHKITSQVCEANADSIAKEHGYGAELANVLYDITVSSNYVIRSTQLFNALKSYHPTIYSRIEHLRA
ncbi:hypothetical protein GINT2_000388 [Glugoides intestinalis]